MNWLRKNEFHSRPLLAVEDHVYHISELLQTLQRNAANLLSHLTIVCLDRRGPDTDEAVAEWSQQCPTLQIAARIADSARFPSHRIHQLPDTVFQSQVDYCRFIAEGIRKGGLLLQDIELEPLEFIPRDRWWETTMLASTVRGIVGDRAPRCAFISNKRGYEATFGAELLAAGHDPRDVLNKYEMERLAVPLLQQHLDNHFGLELGWREADSAPNGEVNRTRVAADSCERREIETELDIVLWPEQDRACEIGGRAFARDKKAPLVLPVDGNEWETWRQLIESRLQGEAGVEVQQIGTRVAPERALRAETTNAAARHIHALRKRLTHGQDIVTVQGCYCLRDGLKVGMAMKPS